MTEREIKRKESISLGRKIDNIYVPPERGGSLIEGGVQCLGEFKYSQMRVNNVPIKFEWLRRNSRTSRAKFSFYFIVSLLDS